ncbi:MAG: PhoH family protein, partial [Methylococcales bacterium]|nr:PhoH family protein [Methylococcales bacterium]
MVKEQKKRFVLDTNVLLHEPLAIYSFKEHDVVIPMTVLEELDQIKDRKKDVSRDARVAIRTLENCVGDAPPDLLLQGVPLNHPNAPDESLGKLAIFPDHQVTFANPVNLPGDNNDNRIINAALYLQQQSSEQIVLVTKDINMRLKAKGAGLEKVEDYRTDQLVDDIQFLAKGFCELEGDIWSQVSKVSSEKVGRDTYHTLMRNELEEESFYQNQFVIDQGDDFCAQVKSVNDRQLVLKDLSRDRLM